MTRSITIDRARHRQLDHDLVWSCISSEGGVRRLTVLVGLGLFLGWWGSSWTAALALAASGVVVQLLLWKRQVRRSLRLGLAVGQSITRGYTHAGELQVWDATGPVWLPRGSAMGVTLAGSTLSVWGRAISFCLPHELLGAADIAFLEGHGEVPEPPTAHATILSLSLRISGDVQEQLVAAQTRLHTRSADFLFPFAVAPVLVTVGLLLGTGWFVASVAYVVGMALLSLPRIRASRARVRRRFPVGSTVRAVVTGEHLTLAEPHLTRRHGWTDFRAHRVRAGVVLLQRTAGRPATTEILPAGLLDEHALRVLERVVPRTF